MAFPPINFIVFIPSFIMGILIFYTIEFIISCLVFWYRNFSLGGWLSSELLKYSRRPDGIFKGVFRKVIFSIFPMAMISSVPARMLIFGPDYQLLFLQILIVITLLLFSRFIWTRGLKLYESASS